MIGSARSSTAGPAVIQVVLSLGRGGTERLVIEISQRLTPRFRMAICCLEDAGLWARQLTDQGIEVVALGRQPGFHPSLGYHIARVAARHGAVLLHCHHYSPFVYGRIAACLNHRLRIVFTEHGRLSDGAPSRKRQLVNPVLGRFGGHFCAVSEDLKRHMVAEGFPADRVGVIYNGIDIGAVVTPTDRRQARRLLGIREEAFLIGTVARLDPVKDLPTLIEAFAALRLSGDAELVVIGEGPERPRLAEGVRQARLNGAVHFTGHRDDVLLLLPALDLFVSTSTHEGVSLTILEAMAASIPVVATAVGGTPEVVANGESGVLVPPRAPAELARAMDALMRAPERRQQFGAAGRQRVERLFTIDRMVADYARVYEGLVRH